MSILTRFFVSDSLQILKNQEDPIKKAGMAMSQYIPVQVTSFYLTFFAAAGGQTEPEKALAQFIVLPMLGLLATFVVSIPQNFDKKSSETKWWKKTQWGGVTVSTVAFIGWVYVTGGHFFDWIMPPFFVALTFAFLGIVVPVIYGLLQKR